MTQPTRPGVARAVLSAIHPRGSGDPDHAAAIALFFPLLVDCAWRAMVYHRHCLLATGLLAAAITVRTGAISLAPQATPPATASKAASQAPATAKPSAPQA